MEKLETEILFTKDTESILITIPVSLIKWAAENHGEYPMEIKDANAFAEKVMFELEHNLGAVESGLTGFQELLDKAMIEVAESGEDFVDFKQVNN